MLLLPRHIPRFIKQTSAIVHVEFLSQSGADELRGKEGSHPTKVGPPPTNSQAGELLGKRAPYNVNQLVNYHTLMRSTFYN
jgi:hypothetical protein